MVMGISRKALRLLAAASCLFVAQGVAVTAATTTITDGTTDYRITTVEGTPSALESLLKAQPWYTGSSDATLAATLADDLGQELSKPNVSESEVDACVAEASFDEGTSDPPTEPNTTITPAPPGTAIAIRAICEVKLSYGPFFAYDFDQTTEEGAALSQAWNGEPSERTTPLGETATFAVLDTAVIPLPGGVPLLASALAAGWAVARRRGGAPAKP
ncbi:MAG: hypothetical protein V2I65_10070 [Paracoccaceae bacterium]|jgi:hypothetical protein|nr:hypothetical protein [Paracoccaceae bacterium]